MPGGRIPDRWLNYTPHGMPIEGTRFVALKVPLKLALCSSVPRKKRFSPDIFMRQHPDIKFIIDLTNTYRYYDSREFKSQRIQYSKIKTEGHIVPSAVNLESFFKVVDDFLNTSNHNNTFIGVHCTHGVNRTGYFVCSYMIQRLGYRPQQAIELFEEARGHKIERENYRNALLDMASRT